MLVLATGGHWAMLQSVAWFGMAVRFSQDQPLLPALQKTFSGAHPCTLCKAVSDGVKTEKDKRIQKLETKYDFFCSGSVTILEAPLPQAAPARFNLSFRSRTEPPRLPPPRHA
jgi:hypothetical protein